MNIFICWENVVANYYLYVIFVIKINVAYFNIISTELVLVI